MLVWPLFKSRITTWWKIELTLKHCKNNLLIIIVFLCTCTSTCIFIYTCVFTHILCAKCTWMHGLKPITVFVSVSEKSLHLKPLCIWLNLRFWFGAAWISVEQLYICIHSYAHTADFFNFYFGAAWLSTERPHVCLCIYTYMHAYICLPAHRCIYWFFFCAAWVSTERADSTEIAGTLVCAQRSKCSAHRSKCSKLMIVGYYTHRLRPCTPLNAGVSVRRRYQSKIWW